MSCAAFLPVALPLLASAQGGWREDAAALVEAVLRIHPDPYRVNGPEVWEAELARFAAILPELEEHERVLGLTRLLALAADGHTEPVDAPHPSLQGPWLPLVLRRFQDGWFVRTGHRDHVELFGKQIVRIGGVPIEEAAARVRPFVSSENEVGALDGIGNMLRDPAVLHAAGVLPERAGEVELVVSTGEGGELPVLVRATDDAWVTPEWGDADRVLDPGPEPLYRRLDGNYDFAWLADERILYVLFETVRDDGDETIAEFFARVFAFVRDHEVEKFVLDLRENGGGNLDLNLPIVNGLVASEVNRPGRLFVVIGRDTYSAAMNLAVTLERHTHALFVGEPTGATPNHFGDTVLVTLPTSGLVVEISELYWQNSDPRDARPWITPDIPAPITSADFFAHRDPALEAIRAYEPERGEVYAHGPTELRWRRPGQLTEQVWPGLIR